jgi:hypothetical protein
MMAAGWKTWPEVPDNLAFLSLSTRKRKRDRPTAVSFFAVLRPHIFWFCNCFKFSIWIKIVFRWVSAGPVLENVCSKESMSKGRFERPDHGKGIWEGAACYAYNWHKQ